MRHPTGADAHCCSCSVDLRGDAGHPAPLSPASEGAQSPPPPAAPDEDKLLFRDQQQQFQQQQKQPGPQLEQNASLKHQQQMKLEQIIQDQQSRLAELEQKLSQLMHNNNGQQLTQALPSRTLQEVSQANQTSHTTQTTLILQPASYPKGTEATQIHHAQFQQDQMQLQDQQQQKQSQRDFPDLLGDVDITKIAADGSLGFEDLRRYLG